MKDVAACEAGSISGTCAVTLLAEKGEGVRSVMAGPCCATTTQQEQVCVWLLFHLGVDFASKVNKPRCYHP